MTAKRPYLIRALYEWISDNGLTPHLLVNAEPATVAVPSQYVHEGRIVLNVSQTAVHNLTMGNEWIEFSARFGGMQHWIQFPPSAVIAVYARENGQGMVFGLEPEGDDTPPSPEPEKPTPERRPALKIVK
jgi:stringent starvation protein B